MGDPILVLIVPFWLAFLAWFAYGRQKPLTASRFFLTLYTGMYITQFLHLIEEWNTGFYHTFPALWGNLF